MLTAMKGELTTDPELRTVPNPKNPDQELKVVDATIAYQKDAEGGKTFVHAVAWEKVAEELAAKKKGDTIEFAGNLTYKDYQNATMDKPRKVLAFSVMALDESQTLCQKLEQHMGVQRRPVDKPGAIFQPMRGKLFNDPELTQINDKNGQPLDACRATLRYWNGKQGEKDAFVSITAYGDAARALSEMKKDDPIQFVGRLDSRPYTNDKMSHSHLELCYNVYSIDPERNLARDTEKFIREQVGLEKKPFKDLVQNAEERKAASSAPGVEAPTKEPEVPAK